MATPLLHVPSGGPWGFAGNGRRVVAPPSTDPVVNEADALAHLVRRHLGAFGPASARDTSAFSRLKVSDIKRTLGEMGDEVETVEGPGGEMLHDLVGVPRVDEDHVAPARLLPMWDSVLLAHHDRRRIIFDEHRAIVIRPNGDTLATVLADGFVAGVWRITDDGLEVATFRALGDDEWSEVEAEAQAMLAVLADRDPRPFGTYDHWWQKLPPDLPRRTIG